MIKMDSSSALLKRLCSQITGITDERIVEHFQLAVTLLHEDFHIEHLDNFKSVTDRMKRWLVQENRMQDALKTSALLSKIEQSKILKNKSAILYLFLCLRQQQSRSSSRTDSDANSSYNPGSSGLVNGFGHDPFHIVSTQGSIGRVTNDNGSRNPLYDVDTHSSRTSREKREGRVARLAALYKGDGTKNLPEEMCQIIPKKDNLKTKKELQMNIWNKDSRTRVPEHVILREVLYSFQGIEGKVLRMNIADDTFKIDPQILLSPGEKDLIMKLTEVGWLYNRVKRFCESHGRNPGGVPQEGTSQSIVGVGLVNQSLAMALREELNEYCKLIAILETQLQDNDSAPVESSGDSSLGLSLRKILLWTMEPRERLKTLCLLTHAARGVRGGASVSEIYRHLQHGDPMHMAVVKNVLSQACRPLFIMLTEWLLDGTLQDSHHEFFIAADPTVTDGKLWHDKYDIRWCMVPSFVSKAQAEKVLATGKSHNFLRNVCNFKGQASDKDAIKRVLQETTVESLFTQDENNKLDDLILLTFHATSSQVLNEILTHHNLLDHLRALRRYLLLGQGDFIHYLLEILEPELCKTASNLHSHNLSLLLETAVMASNAQFEEPDILKRLDYRLLEYSPGETGWDVFSLDYHVDGPIGTVFTPNCMQQYLTLFNSLWKAKHMEWLLCAAWKNQANTSKLCRALPELGGTLHRMQILLTEMVHLVQQMAYYMTFEVLECSWHALMTKLKSAQSLDDIIDAHDHFLKRIMSGALLDKDSRDERTHLRSLYGPMIRLEALQERLANAVIGELAARRATSEEIEERTKEGKFGLTAEIEEREQKRINEFMNNFVPGITRDLKLLTKSYQDMVQEFLLMLTQNEDENLHLLCSRIDFNGHYHQRDHRLNLRLTYLHKRKSMGASFWQ